MQYNLMDSVIWRRLVQYVLDLPCYCICFCGKYIGPIVSDVSYVVNMPAGL